MVILTQPQSPSENNTNEGTYANGHLSGLDASTAQLSLCKTPKDVPSTRNLVFGQSMTDHMLIASFNPSTGWSNPEIKPYGPLTLDPTSSCFQYSTNLFEGMKAYLGPDGIPRLFRPELNMARMNRSRERIALPAFETAELLKLIKLLVMTESRWIPSAPGYSLYIRPTLIGTRPYLGVAASDHAMLFVVCCPAGLYFQKGARMLSLLTVGQHVRAWPGGTGEVKISVNYAPTFMPSQTAKGMGYDEVLWLFGDRITEASGMNFFVAVRRLDGEIDLLTPELDGTVLAGVTRDSMLSLAAAHNTTRPLPGIPEDTKIHTRECVINLGEVKRWISEGRLLEAFATGTAVVVAGIGRLGLQDGEDLVLPQYDSALGPIAQGLYESITAIQEGREEWQGWSARCDID